MMKRSARPVLALCLSLAVLAAGAPVSGQFQAPAPVAARHGMVCTASGPASQVGMEILRRGGNAVDAGVAVALALAVTYPTAGNLGGGGFMMIRKADGKAVAIDYREVAPARATRNLYVGPDGKVIPDASTLGHKAVGVPGTVAGMALALEKYGTMKWKDVVEPARKLAADGFPVTFDLADDLRVQSNLAKFPESRRIFQKDGAFYQAGDVFRQPELAQTLKRIKENGPREFYQGRTAELLVDEMSRSGGLITTEDLKTYRPVEREPLRGTYRGYEIITMPPPSSGGIALLEMLNILERYPLKELGYNSSRKYHLMVEAMRRAFADRSQFLGDPDFVKVPVKGLISRKYADGIARTINPERATPSAQVQHGNPAPYESSETTHFTIVDAQGNAVSNTYTLNGAYGSGVTVRGAGFLLNNEMDDFTSQPGVPNQFGLIQGEANAIQPRKRPLSSMTPTVVLKDGKVAFVIGSPGGPTIINTVLQVTLNVVDHNMNIMQAVSAPRLHHQWLPDEIRHEPFGLSPDVREALEARGHRFAPRAASIGDAQGVQIDAKTGLRLGAADPRNPDGRAVGY